MHLAIIKLSINCNLLFCLSISNWSASIHNPEMHELKIMMDKKKNYLEPTFSLSDGKKFV